MCSHRSSSLFDIKSLFVSFFYVLICLCLLFFFLMIRRPPRSTHCISSAASDVYKRQYQRRVHGTNFFQGQQVIVVSCGQQHTVAITNKNQIFTFGWNSYGQLGDNSFKDKNTPINITDKLISNNQTIQPSKSDQIVEKIINASCGIYHTIVQTNKSLYGFGGNSAGQLGKESNDSNNKLAPFNMNYLFENGSEFQQVVCGNNHTLVLTNKGVYSFGSNQFGQLGNNSKEENSNAPVNITKYFNNENIVSINCGKCHSIVETQDNIYAFGDNSDGQLGMSLNKNENLPIKITSQLNKEKIKQIICLSQFNFIETGKGLYAFGNNQYGQLGIKETNSVKQPTLVGEYFK
eukprot:TRINITY_DN35073_c0_g1_i1.p1 TRINITY_DN35073_c0_g1~~TRINITY_DN35073_c0_g1_i1.p1  ORF type:complete len:348 (+),score=70.74 TRINITY_DN35073_c0_g1_i1:36-1079(+)